MRPDCDGFQQFPSDLKPQSESNICLRNLTSLVAMVGGAFLLIAMLLGQNMKKHGTGKEKMNSIQVG